MNCAEEPFAWRSGGAGAPAFGGSRVGHGRCLRRRHLRRDFTGRQLLLGVRPRRRHLALLRMRDEKTQAGCRHRHDERNQGNTQGPSVGLHSVDSIFRRREVQRAGDRPPTTSGGELVRHAFNLDGRANRVERRSTADRALLRRMRMLLVVLP